MELKRKNMWRLSRDLEIASYDVVADEESGVAVYCRALDGDCEGCTYTDIGLGGFFDTREECEAERAKKIEYIKEMIPKVRKFIKDMRNLSEENTLIPFKREDYLGDYASRSTSSYYNEYRRKQEYAEKLESFVRSRMLNIGGWMLPVGEVKKVQWFFNEDRGDEYEERDWLAELTMAGGETYRTGSRSEVRLVKTVFGENSGIYYIDNEFDYDKDE